MKAKTNVEEPFALSSDRLKHTLDKLGFRDGRGRTKGFHAYLVEKRPDIFKDLKYTTVRSWFQGQNSPLMEKIDVIIDALLENYSSDRNAMSLKTWWKVGGVYPFAEESKEMDLMINGIVTEMMVKENFRDIDLDKFESVKEKINQLAADWYDPNADIPRRLIQLYCADLIKDSFPKQ